MLKGVRILFVEDDIDSRELVTMMLGGWGADVREADTGETAVEIARTWAPDVVLADLMLRGIDGVEMLRRVRELPGLGAVPAIALTGRGTSHDRTYSLAGGFEKHLLKPTPGRDIGAALSAICHRRESTFDVRTLLTTLNAAGACQYTSVFRFAEDGTLVSVWTYDRAAPAVDPFVVGLPIEASYCVLVRDSGELTAIEDARTDDRAADHPKREQLAAYLGVPIFDANGKVCGTLCSYDIAPQAFSGTMRDRHTAAAKALSPFLARWGQEVVARGRVELPTKGL